MLHAKKFNASSSNRIGLWTLFNKEIVVRGINLDKAKSLIYGSMVLKLINVNGDYKKYTKYLLKYSNISYISLNIKGKNRTIFRE